MEKKKLYNLHIIGKQEFEKGGEGNSLFTFDQNLVKNLEVHYEDGDLVHLEPMIIFDHSVRLATKKCLASGWLDGENKEVAEFLTWNDQSDGEVELEEEEVVGNLNLKRDYGLGIDPNLNSESEVDSSHSFWGYKTSEQSTSFKQKKHKKN